MVLFDLSAHTSSVKSIVSNIYLWLLLTIIQNIFFFSNMDFLKKNILIKRFLLNRFRSVLLKSWFLIPANYRTLQKLLIKVKIIDERLGRTFSRDINKTVVNIFSREISKYCTQHFSMTNIWGFINNYTKTNSLFLNLYSLFLNLYLFHNICNTVYDIILYFIRQITQP